MSGVDSPASSIALSVACNCLKLPFATVCNSPRLRNTGSTPSKRTRENAVLGWRRRGTRNSAFLDCSLGTRSYTALTIYICLVSTTDICPVSAADIYPVPTADICPVSTENVYPVSIGALIEQDEIFQTPKTYFASQRRKEFCQAMPRAEVKTDTAKL